MTVRVFCMKANHAGESGECRSKMPLPAEGASLRQFSRGVCT